MPEAEFILEYEGESYTLDLEDIEPSSAGPQSLDWVNSYFQIPPKVLALKLWDQILQNHYAAFLGAIGRERLRQVASCLQNQDLPTVALPLIEHFLEENPRDQWAFSFLSASLRKLGRPQEAIERTELPGHGSSALATSRGAAYCDLGNANMAKKEADKAMAISRGKASQELISLYKRIKEGKCGR